MVFKLVLEGSGPTKREWRRSTEYRTVKVARAGRGHLRLVLQSRFRADSSSTPDVGYQTTVQAGPRPQRVPRESALHATSCTKGLAGWLSTRWTPIRRLQAQRVHDLLRRVCCAGHGMESIKDNLTACRECSMRTGRSWGHVIALRSRLNGWKMFELTLRSEHFFWRQDCD